MKAEALGEGARVSTRSATIIRARAQRVRLRRPVHLAALRLHAAPRTTTALCSPMYFMPEIRIPTLVAGGVRRSVDPDRALSRRSSGATMPGFCRCCPRPAAMSASTAMPATGRGPTSRSRSSWPRVQLEISPTSRWRFPVQTVPGARRLGCRWHQHRRPFEAGIRDTPTPVSNLSELTAPGARKGTAGAGGKRLRRKRRKKGIIMRATLHHRAIEHLIGAMAPRVP